VSTRAEEGSGALRRAGRQQAIYENLARRFYAGVYNYLCWISRDEDLAEDLTQETFMRVWQHFEEIRDSRATRAWVYRIARNQFLQHRRAAALDTVSFEACAQAGRGWGVALDPEIGLEREALCRAVRQAVEELPDPYREVIVLHNLEHLSLAQVAQVLDVPVGTVKSRRARALAALRQLLQQEVLGDEV
jgi:RNA polymerase sigma-70 factor (ECF subfamily)